MANNNGSAFGAAQERRRRQAEQAKQPAHEQHARMEFNEGFSSGRFKVLDRFGRVVDVDTIGILLLDPTQPPVFQVSKVVPSLDPRDPVGVVQLVLTTTIPIKVIAGRPWVTFTAIGRADSTGAHAQLDAVDQPPPAAPDGSGVVEDGPADGAESSEQPDEQPAGSAIALTDAPDVPTAAAAPDDAATDAAQEAAPRGDDDDTKL